MLIILLAVLVILAIAVVFSPIKGAKRNAIGSLFLAIFALFTTSIMFVPAFKLIVIPLSLAAVVAAFSVFTKEPDIPMPYKLISSVSILVGLFASFIAVTGTHLIDLLEKYL